MFVAVSGIKIILPFGANTPPSKALLPAPCSDPIGIILVIGSYIPTSR